MTTIYVGYCFLAWAFGYVTGYTVLWINRIKEAV
jgi:hypothetical protein